MKHRDTSSANMVSDQAVRLGNETMGQLSLLDILSIIWRRKIFVIAGGLAGLVLVVLFAAGLAPKYVSESAVLVDLRRLEVSKNGLIPNVPPSALETLVKSERSLLTSNSVLLKVVDKHELQNDPEFGGSSGAGLVMSVLKGGLGLGGNGDGGSDRRVAAAAKLSKALTVIVKKDTVVLTVALSSRDAAKAQKLNRSLIEAYLAERQQNAVASVNRVVETLEAQLNGQARAVAQAEDAVESYKINNNIVDANGQLNSDLQVTTITNQLNAAQLAATQAQSRYEQVRDLIRLGKVEAAGSNLLDSDLLSSLRSRLLQAKDQRSILQATLQSAHPSMVEINTRITSLKNALQTEARDVLKVIEQDLKRARKVEANLKKELAQLQQQTGHLKKSLVPLRELERKAEAARSVYVSTLTRIREIRAQQGVNDSNVRVISEASLPLKNQRISRSLLAMLGAAFGGTIGAFIAFFTAPVRGIVAPEAGPVRHAEQVQSMTGLPVLGHVPLVMPMHGRGRSARRASGGAIADLVGLSGSSIASRGVLSNLYNQLRAFDDSFSDEEAQSDVVLMLTLDDVCQSEIYSANLAAMAYDQGDDVLYVDGTGDRADLLRSYLSAGVSNIHPLHEGERSSGHLDRLMDGGLSHGDEAIDFLSLSGAQGRQSHSLESLALQLDDHIDDYDFVLLDGGALFEQPALNVFSYFADHIILLVQEQQTDFDALDRAYQRLGEARDKVVGCLYIEGRVLAAKKQQPLEGADLPLSYVAWGEEQSPVANPFVKGRSRRRSYG
ncbi:MAG: exopolysaccharide transport family protein [Cohaesibacter sp.]|nr:exopolysaccharide transport family protein [Cohaesibacter sp.]